MRFKSGCAKIFLRINLSIKLQKDIYYIYNIILFFVVRGFILTPEQSVAQPLIQIKVKGEEYFYL